MVETKVEHHFEHDVLKLCNHSIIIDNLTIMRNYITLIYENEN